MCKILTSLGRSTTIKLLSFVDLSPLLLKLGSLEELKEGTEAAKIKSLHPGKVLASILKSILKVS